MKHLNKIIFVIAIVLGLFSHNFSVKADFFDIKQGHPLYETIQELEKLNIISPSKYEKFYEFPEISKEFLTEMLLRSINYHKENKESVFSGIDLKDVEKNMSNAPYIYKAIKLGIVDYDKGKNEFNPKKALNKQEVLRMFMLANGINIPPYVNPLKWDVKDVDINSWIAPLIQRSLELELAVLDGNKEFHPFKKYTKEEAVKLIYDFQSKKSTFNAIKENVIEITAVIQDENSVSLDDYPKLDILLDVYRQLNNNYLFKDQINKEKLMYDAVSGMISNLKDPHTSFIPSTDINKSVIQVLTNELEGIGAEISSKNGEITVVTPYKGTPAEKVGLKTNDIILSIDGQSTKGLNAEQAAQKIRGKSGTKVILEIKRSGYEVPLKFEITREKISLKSVEYKLEENFAFLSISLFRSNTADEFEKAAQEIKKSGARGLILDLRNNSGGFLDASIEVLSHFIEKEKLLTSIVDVNKEETKFYSKGYETLKNLPIVVLINEGSASASEIVTASLKDYELAKLVGTKSYGKGSVQQLTIYQDQSEFKLTMAKWLTPNGNWIDEKGIEPDIKIDRTTEDLTSGKDPQLDQAKQALREMIQTYRY